MASVTETTKFSGLAFVDLETTGLSPTEDRVAEIGVITVDGDGQHVERWTTFVRPPARRVRQDPAVTTTTARTVTAADMVTDESPRFADIAHDLSARLAGRL